MTKIRGPTTLWGRVALIIFVLSLVFSIIALLLTIYALQTFPIAIEWVPPTREVFRQFGFLFGGLLQTALIFVSTLALPLCFLVILKLFSKDLSGDSIIGNVFASLLKAIIDGWAIASVLSSFFDMYNDILIILLIQKEDIFGILKLDWFRGFILWIWEPAFLIGLFLSLSIRLCWYWRIKTQYSKQMVQAARQPKLCVNSVKLHSANKNKAEFKKVLRKLNQ